MSSGESPAFMSGFEAYNCCVIRASNPNTKPREVADWYRGWDTAKYMHQWDQYHGAE